MQLIHLKHLCHACSNFFHQPQVQRVMKIILMLSLMGLVMQVFAEDDLLKGSEKELLATIKGTGKIYVYLSEGIVAIVSYIGTKNIFVFFGVIIISIFFNVLFLFAK